MFMCTEYGCYLKRTVGQARQKNDHLLASHMRELIFFPLFMCIWASVVRFCVYV